MKFTIKNPENMQMGNNDFTYQEDNYDMDMDMDMDMDIPTTIIVAILILSIGYYLMNFFGKKSNSRTNWIVIIALVVSAIYLLIGN